MKERLTRAWAALALLLAAVALALPASAAGPALAATEAYCIMDAESGLVLAQQNMDEELHPASITKVMTLGLACEKAQGDWSGMVTVSHEDVYSLVGTDSSHIALLEGEQVPLEALLYATMMASANDGANALAEYFGGGSIADGVAAMNAQAAELGLQHTHFANPHGISDDGHYTSCYDMATILRWALTQPGFEQLFTNNEMYIMQPTNLQPVTRYFSQQDSMRIGSSMFHEPTILGSKIGYTDIDEAGDGVSALAKLRESKFGLIISDWNMEPMTGLQLLKEIRADAKLAATPFIMVTAERKTENVIAAKQAGVNNYIVKPFNADTLKQKIQAVIGG